MIAIVNVGGDMRGICEYELRINREVITTFNHNRTENLAVCLRKAADAYDTYEQSVIVNRYLDGGR